MNEIIHSKMEIRVAVHDIVPYFFFVTVFLSLAVVHSEGSLTSLPESDARAR